jgi:hypothetical protein
LAKDTASLSPVPQLRNRLSPEIRYNLRDSGIKVFEFPNNIVSFIPEVNHVNRSNKQFMPYRAFAASPGIE